MTPLMHVVVVTRLLTFHPTFLSVCVKGGILVFSLLMALVGNLSW